MMALRRSAAFGSDYRNSAMIRGTVFGLALFGRKTHCFFEKLGFSTTPQNSNEFDVVIVGGGIIGCATARHLKMCRPRMKVALIEKEPELSFHQTGHNSGVLHAGIYYLPGSLKAKLCVEGIDMAYAYLDEKKIPYRRCGKLIVAVEESEIPALENLYARAQKNGCKQIEMVSADRIREIEPHCRGLKAIWSPYTGIVDWALVAKSFAEDFVRSGGQVYCSRPLRSIELSGDGSGEKKCAVKLVSDRKEDTLYADYVITCAGLQSDRVAQMTGCSPLPKIMPFRGDYLYLKPEKHHLVSTNIYPVPNPNLPFLGVHFTPTMRGEVLLGPNAVLALKREGYSMLDFSFSDFYEAMSFSGMRKLIYKYFAFGVRETFRGVFISAQVRQLQRFIPELKRRDVIRGRSGVRAQALDEHGNLVDDFVFDSGVGPYAQRILHVRNAPSPGATSSMSIAKMVVEEALKKFAI